ncbi:EF-hand domain-containing protein [Fundidesulfovibrio terrae]|uniref:EF-hand domain-containing protein n=1 Tax=Fundidesulfovibrio terrae TaxID=2922866 RepID=UPI001FAF80BC|nr:EF-hand domain-containing protein [Fundidesulfovibrio terrae]
MRHRLFASALMLMLGLAATSAFAQTPDRHPFFDKMDANKDGFLTKDEVQARFPKFTDEMFKQADVNGDGKLTVAEWQAFVKGRRAARQGAGM